MKKNLILVGILSLLFPQFAFAAACSSLTNGLAASYSLDGNSTDATGNGNNGADTSMSYSTTNAVVNQAGQFGGSSDILIPDSSSFDSPTTGASLAGWFYVTAGTVSGTIIGKSTVAAPNGQYMRLDVNSATLNATVDGDQVGSINGGTTLLTNTRYFAAITYDGAHINLYLGHGGTVTTDATQVTFSGATTPSTGQVGIGILGSFSGHQFFTGGAIDIANWYTCGLTLAQITSLYNAGNGLQYPFTTTSPSPASDMTILKGVQVIIKGVKAILF